MAHRSLRWTPLALALLAAACAQAPVEPATAPPAPAAPVASASSAEAIARYRRSAESARQAGDLATAAAQWQVVTLLAPGDADARRELAAVHAAIAKESREQLAVGQAALAAGDVDRATRALLRVLAVDPGQPDAAKALREIDRRRFTRIQGDRAAKVAAQEQAAAQRGGAKAPAAMGGDGDGFDVEQALEMFRAGDSAGGLRDLKAYVDANPGNRAARQRIAAAVAERGKELEDKGSREEALNLYEQATALRGDAGGAWVARMAPLRKTLSREYFDKGSRAFTTNLAQAITLLETSLRYDPANAQAAAKLKDARAAQAKLDSIK